jgi:hypothetical protein
MHTIMYLHAHLPDSKNNRNGINDFIIYSILISIDVATTTVRAETQTERY